MVEFNVPTDEELTEKSDEWISTPKKDLTQKKTKLDVSSSEKQDMSKSSYAKFLGKKGLDILKIFKKKGGMCVLNS
jgi:hypothetical protein